MDHPRRVALFGGTFDPVHLGHLAIARSARLHLGLDQVVFIPCRQSPHKAEPSLAGEEDRVEMLQLALATDPWALVSEVELHLPTPSYSWVTAEAMSEIYPSARLFWLMGSDQWEVIDTWSRPQYLASLVEFVVHDREGKNRSRPGFQAHFIPGSHPASAREIRASAPENLATTWLHPAVSELIRSRHLYGCQS